LHRDLGATVARPALRELGEVAQGIADLAAELSGAQKEQARLSRELADKERLAALGRVAAGVAHEVRNPLASIKLRVDMARLEAEAPPPLLDELASVSSEIARLDRFVADLLTVAGRRSGTREPTDLGTLADQRVKAIEPWARERGVRLHVSGEAPVRGDADALGRAIDNLVRNAVEASRPGAEVGVVATADRAEGRLIVTDEGPGVPVERVHELYEPFFTTKQEGTGLGLALARAVANAHGGTLRYERDAGKTRFELVLPVSMTPRDKASAA
jgi:signal transduction histidine kinase